MTSRTTRLLAAVLSLIAGATSATAQTITVPTLPATLTVSVSWNDPSLATAKPDTYRVTVGSAPSITVPATKPTPCTACALVPVTVTATGDITISVMSVNATGSSQAVTTVPVIVQTGAPSAVTNITLTLAVVSPAATLVPPAVSLTAPDGAVWTRSAAPITCAVATWPAAQCYSVLRNGAVVGVGYEIYLAADKLIYRHSPDGQWYQWHNPDWWTWGPTKPQ